MKIIYMGNQEIGCKCLEYLINSKENIQAVFAIDDSYWRGISGKSSIYNWYPSVGQLAEKNNIKTFYPEDVNDDYHLSLIKKLNPDVIFSISWDQMLGQEILDIPEKGCINMHFSLLPKHRGHSPVNWVIIKGDKTTGISMHYMVKRADAGKIIAQRECPVFEEDSSKLLLDRLSGIGYELFMEQFSLIKSGKNKKIFMDLSKGNYNPRRRPEDGLIDWNKNAREIYNWVRALTRPYPGAFTFIKGKKLFIWKVKVLDYEDEKAEPGQEVKNNFSQNLIIKTGQGLVEILDSSF
jgi:methionyl-tRNA formyltransferase